MAKAERVQMHAHKSYSKQMSNHVAYALVIYTMLLIWRVTPTMETDGTSIFPYFLLVLFVAAVIPSAHGLEKRWQKLQESDLGDGGLDTRFAMDRVKLWVAAILIPFGIAAISSGITSVI